MWVIQKATTNENNILYGLKDDSTLVSPVYLFVFSKGGVDYPVILTDLATSSQKEEYSKFTLIEGADDPTNGSLILGTTGVYDLVIYEQSSSTNLDPNNATYVQDTLARVIDSENISSAWIEHTIDLTFYEHSV